MVVLQGWCFELGFMPKNHFSGSDTSRPEMGIIGIMDRARGMQIVENVFHVRMMFLLLGLFLSIVNLPIASGQAPPGDSEQNPIIPPLPPSIPPSSQAPPPPPILGPPPPPPSFTFPIPPPPPPVGSSPDPGESPSPPASGTSPPPPPPSPGSPSPTPVVSPPPLEPPPPSPPGTTLSAPIGQTGGDTWNESEKAGVVIASIAALLQVAVVAFLLIKRHQMLTTVEYDDLEDKEYDTPPDSNFRDIESA